jgi:hypothetical protein
VAAGSKTGGFFGLATRVNPRGGLRLEALVASINIRTIKERMSINGKLTFLAAIQISGFSNLVDQNRTTPFVYSLRLFEPPASSQFLNHVEDVRRFFAANCSANFQSGEWFLGGFYCVVNGVAQLLSRHVCG